MYKSKLLTTLSNLEKKEQDSLKIFLKSPFFNNDPKVFQFYNLVIKLISAQKDFNKSSIFEKIYPGEPYSDTKLRLLQSNLFKLIEHFLKYQLVFQKERYYPENLLLSYYRDQKLYKCQKAQTKSIQQSIAEQKFEEEGYYYHELHFLDEVIKNQAQAKNIEPKMLQHYFDKVQETHVLFLLKSACRLLTEQSVYNYSLDIGLVPHLMSWLEKNLPALSPKIKLYYAYFKMLKDPSDESSYRDYRDLLRNYSELFDRKELRDLFLAANNYCIRKANQGNKRYELQALNNYKDALEKEVLFENGTLSQRTYNNIIALALKSNQLDWANEFMEQFTTRLSFEEQKSSYHLNMARLAYVQKDYEKGLELLQDADFKPMLNNLSAKTLMIKLFYEMEEYDVLYYQLKAMRAFLYRKKVMGYHKKAFINLIRYTEKLLRLRPHDRQKIVKMKEDILLEDIIWEKDWLLTQLKNK